MEWYYVHGNQKQGPISEEEFKQLVSNGTVSADTMVWRTGMIDWQMYGGIAKAGPPEGDNAICQECKKTFSADDMVSYGDSWVCAACKPRFLQKLKEGVPTFGNYRWAGFWIRGGAVLLDGILLWVIQILILLPFRVPPFSAENALDTPELDVGVGITLLLQIIIPIAYETFFIGKFGATLGKMACKIQVITTDGGRVGYLRAFARYWAKLVSGIILCIGYIMAGFDSEKRGLHDRMCNTRVVYK